MTTNPKPILITGATGSIGSMLAQRLSESGQVIRTLVRNPTQATKLKSLGNVEIIQGDLTQPDSLHNCMENCSLVYHCAAKLPGSDWSAYRAINVEGTKALLREAAKSGVERFIHLSTIGVYACSQAENISEDFPLPKSDYPYFATKQDAEHAVGVAADQVPITVARLGDVIGPGQQTWTINFIRMIKQGILYPPTDADSGILNPVYIDNLIEALIRIGTHPVALGQVFNIVDGTPIRFSDYIRRLTRMTGKRPFAVPGFVLKSAATLLMGFDLLRGREASVKPGDVDYLLHKATINGEKARSVLGWKPSIDLEEGFRRTEVWLRSEGFLS